MSPLDLSMVALGSGLGGATRVALATRADRPGLPLGVLIANLGGSLVLGLLAGLAVGPGAMALLGTGWCGGLTTYSTFAVQTRDLGGRRGTAYAAATLCGGLAACAVGWAVGHALA